MRAITLWAALALFPANIHAPADDVPLPCDTWVALSDATVLGCTILAKNSDRPLFDCQPLVLHPRRKWHKGATLNLGRIQVPQVAETYATLGSSPYWCWGYEEGVNEFGVAIGNEGIFTRSLRSKLIAEREGNPPSLGPTGMDLLRMALERGTSAREALEVLTELLEEYGQFGSGTPTFPASAGAYENSYIIADPGEAWVLETLGRKWIARRVASGTTSISNAVTIGTDWDLVAEGLIEQVVEDGWWSGDAEGFEFARACQDDRPEILAQIGRARTRAACSARLLEEWEGQVSVGSMMQISRDRSSQPGLDLDQTASGSVAVLPKGEGEIPVFWWCPATPSNSCYVPFFVHGSRLPGIVSRAGTRGDEVTPPSQVLEDQFSEDSFWWLFRDLCDQSRALYRQRNPVIRAAFDPLEEEFANGLPEVLRGARALRSQGRWNEAAKVLDSYSAACVERVVPVVQELRQRFENEVAQIPAELQPYLGEYLSTISTNRVTIDVQDGSLALSLPGQGVFVLQEPDASGRRCLALMPQVAVSFRRNEEGELLGMLLHQGGLDIELVRAGVEIPPEVELAELEKYLGEYESKSSGITLRVFLQNNRLAIDWPGKLIFELHTPDAEECWTFRLVPTMAVKFHADSKGTIQSVTYIQSANVMDTWTRLPGPEGAGTR